MNRQQFLAELNQYLTFFSPEERTKIISAYNEKFDSVGPEGEETLVAKLGTPRMSAIDLKRRMEAGEKATIDSGRDASEDETLSEYSVETETEESLNESDETSDEAPADATEQSTEDTSDPTTEAPKSDAPQEVSRSHRHEDARPSRKVNVFALIGAALLSLVIVAVFLAVAAVGVVLLVAMSYLLLTGLKNLVYVTDALLLFGGGLVCAGLGFTIVWFAVSSAIGLISKLFRSALRAGADKECDA